MTTTRAGTIPRAGTIARLTLRGSPTTPTEVERILRRAAPLSEWEATQIHRVYAGPLARYANRAGANEPEAVANLALFDTFRAHARCPIVDEAAFRAYAYRAARSHTLNEARRRPPRPVAPDEIALTDACPSAEAAGRAVVERMWLSDLLGQLTVDQAEVLKLRLVEGLSAEEAGRRLGRAANAIYQLQHRAQRRLRRLARPRD